MDEDNKCNTLDRVLQAIIVLCVLGLTVLSADILLYGGTLVMVLFGR
ncbi:MAG: hypothetical protein GY918_08470 [Gammaproteobacteria bacterium]|nr:hypothetical protein [Gammaproteobacteria bacterium]